jgi:tetratricopeptide (TPR) repeat protein
MKERLFLLILISLIPFFAFSQKEQIKAAEREFRGDNAQAAIVLLNQVEPNIDNIPFADKAYFFYVKGITYWGLTTQNVNPEINRIQAAMAFGDLIALEKKTETKYNEKVKTEIATLKADLIRIAIESRDKSDFSKAMKSVYAAYLLDKTDIENLLFASEYAMSAEQYEQALTYLLELKKLNYSGIETKYYAVSNETGKAVYFGKTLEAKKNRDLAIEQELYSQPRDSKTNSKLGNMMRNLALAYTKTNRFQEAKAAMQDAIKANPEDPSLIIAQAKVQIQTKDFYSYRELIDQAIAKDPTNVDLFYEVAQLHLSAKNKEEAEMLFKKIIDLDPSFLNAYTDLVKLKLDQEKEIKNQIAKLGTTPKDLKKYNGLKQEIQEVLKDVVPYLRMIITLDPKNTEAKNTLLRCYKNMTTAPE